MLIILIYIKVYLSSLNSTKNSKTCKLIIKIFNKFKHNEEFEKYQSSRNNKI
jgi:hypothetical protein